MVQELQKLLENSYAPYSKFRVACIVKMKDKMIFSGVNVENASYGATICAERNAITTAVASGYRKGDFDSLFVMVDSEKVSSCCFLCRQVITEFFDQTSLITLFNKHGEKFETTVSDLCPMAFTEDDLR